jgi:hypothetical protein
MGINLKNFVVLFVMVVIVQAVFAMASEAYIRSKQTSAQ